MQLSTPNARERVCICEALQMSESPDTLSGRPEAGIEAQKGRRSQMLTSTHIHARSLLWVEAKPGSRFSHFAQLLILLWIF